MADDFSDEEPDSPGSTPRGGKKRANHNELERKRRQHQKDRLNDLKDVVPQLRQERPSTVLILTKAKEYIESLENKTTVYETELVGLRERAGVPAKPARPYTAVVGAASADELDSLRQENLNLQGRLEVLEKKLGAISKNARMPAPAPMMQQHQYLANTDKLAAAEPRVGLAVVAAAAMAAESGPEPSNSAANFRKRKSRADNDFEAAKMDFYRRRNSTVETMRDHAQRITEVNLLQNFARRASLPSAMYDPSMMPEEPDKDVHHQHHQPAHHADDVHHHHHL